MPGSSTRRARNRFRPEIQALRALAVSLVVIFHIWPSMLSGGFIGVDVFFVISGFLITSHLLREADTTGRVSLSAFWARRIRRLLPSALTVLLASVAALIVVLPHGVWLRTLREIAASALYVQNWLLAADSIDYMAATNTPTLVQHFWSLSVEEQFYVAWPLLLLAALGLCRVLRLPAGSHRWALFATVLILAGTSLAWSIAATRADQASAYFVTTTRAWELAAGALLAFVPRIEAIGTATGPRRYLQPLLGWVGLALILIAAVRFDGATAFPGYSAIMPVLGTVLVIFAGYSSHPRHLSSIATFAPIRFLGTQSYTLYLWHWPVIICAGQITGRAPNHREGVLIIAISILLAWLTTRFVERPLLTHRNLLGTRTRAYLFAAIGMVVVTATCGALYAAETAGTGASTASQQRLTDQRDPCLGANRWAQKDACDSSEKFGDELFPAGGAANEGLGAAQACWSEDYVPWKKCHYGSDDSTAPRVALVGDSHAAMAFAGLSDVIAGSGISLDLYVGRTCIWMSDRGARNPGDCTDIRSRVQDSLETGHYDAILTTAYSRGFDVSGEGNDARFRAAWAPLIAAGTKVVVLADNPWISDQTLACLASADRSFARAQKCDSPRHPGLGDELMVKTARATRGVAVIDLSDLYCTATQCPVAIGNVAVYRDVHHLTESYAKTVGPFLLEKLRAYLPAAHRGP